MLEGLAEVFKILANKANGKAPTIMISMYLVYLICVAEVINFGILGITVITGLAVFYMIIQAIVEVKTNKEEPDVEK